MEPAQFAGGVVLAVLVPAWVAWGWCVAREAWDAARAAPRRATLGALVVFGAALVLRLMAPAVPHDLNPRTDDVLHSWRGLDWHYAHGLIALFRVVWAVGVPVDDLTVFHVVACFGALTVPLVGLLTLRLGGGWVAGAVAAVALGGLGLHVRYSHTDAPQVVEGALVVIGALLCAGDGLSSRRTRWAAGLSLGLAASMRPEGIVLPALVVGWAWLCRQGSSARALLLLGMCATVLALPDFVSILAFGRSLQDPSLGLQQGHGLLRYGSAHLVVWSTAFVPSLLSVWVLLAPSGRPALRATMATAALLVAVGALVPNEYWSIALFESWCLARHQLRVLSWMVVLVGVGVEAMVDRLALGLPVLTAPLGVVAVLGAGLATATTLPEAYASFTPAEEYQFVRAHLPEVRAGCTIATLHLEGDMSLVLPELLTQSVGVPHTWTALDALPSDGSCVVYYRSAACTAVSFKTLDTDRCASFEQAHMLTPLAVGGLVDRGWLFERYGGAPVRVGFYRVGSGAP